MKIDAGGRPSYLLALISAMFAVTLHAAPACKYVKFGSLPMAVDGRLPHVDGVVNGAAMRLLIDTGASTTSLTGRLAERLHLALGHTEIGAVSHRVLFAISQRRFYFNWQGGKVFKPD